MEVDGLIAELENREEERNQRWREAEPNIVEGIVDGQGVAGFGIGKETRLGITLHTWRIIEGPIEEGVLYIHHPVSGFRYRRLLKQLQPWAQIRFLVRLDSVRSSFYGRERTDALGLKLLGRNLSCPDLQSIVGRLQMPVVVSDSELGRFTLDRGRRSFLGKLTVDGAECSVCLRAISDDSCDFDSLRQASEVIERQDHEIRETIMEACFGNYDGWGRPLGDLTREEFMSKPNLVFVSVDGQRVTLYFDDGGLFLGHSIRVEVDGNQVKYARLEG